MSVAAISNGLARGAFTVTALISRLLEHINATDGRFRAYATVMADEALAAAEAADRARAAGGGLGPLHGVPVGLKDIIATIDAPTHVGSLALRDWSPGIDATLAARLRAAGAIVVGKLQTTEGACGAHHPSIRPPVNPVHGDAWTGVSSSGAGVGVAAGLCVGAFGSDTGGSIRFPSHCCGVVGLKPTYGRISRHGVYPLAESLDHVGPMARNVADVAALYEAVAGLDSADSTTLAGEVTPWVPTPGAVARLRVGYDERYCSEGLEPAVADALAGAVAKLRDAGATIAPVEVPSLGETVSAWLALCATEACAAHRQTYPAQQEAYGPALRALLDFGARVSEVELEAAGRDAAAFRQRYDAVFNDVDLVMSPTMADRTPSIDEAAKQMRGDGLRRFVAYTAPANLCGNPALCLPAGLDARGYPFGFQLVGRRLAESALFDAGHAIEGAG